jgi:hypothetical protein
LVDSGWILDNRWVFHYQRMVDHSLAASIPDH